MNTGEQLREMQRAFAYPLEDRIAQLEAQLVGYDKLSRDANRYRWFRWNASESFYGDEIIRLVNDPISLDSAIDARLNGSAPKPEQQEPRHTPAEPVQEPVASAPSLEAAYAMGAKGGTAVEGERLAFEEWMRGHCWALCATWNGTNYVSDSEQGGSIDGHAMRTRMLWAAWRDRAALYTAPKPSDNVASEPDVQSELNEKRENICRLLIELDAVPRHGHCNHGPEKTCGRCTAERR